MTNGKLLSEIRSIEVIAIGSGIRILDELQEDMEQEDGVNSKVLRPFVLQTELLPALKFIGTKQMESGAKG